VERPALECLEPPSRSGFILAQAGESSLILIPRYLEDKYKLEITPLVNSNINRAIISGEEKGAFVLPKGEPSQSRSLCN
jgi:hypothetical protein